ncbi:MAG: 2OG-Fe(II) oxygenase [Myxococcales bacterium]|nr:2OG-Fe(II) oxygenase [Myxococcales bacterium]
MTVPEVSLSDVADAVAAVGYCVVPALVGPEVCAAMRARGAQLRDAGALSSAAIGAADERHIRADIRGDLTAWMRPHTEDAAERAWLEQIEGLRVEINRRTFEGLFEWEGHWALYPPGRGYARHLDVFRAHPMRLYSTVLYLNDAWQEGDGGELRLELGPDQARTVPPTAGTLVVFRSDRFYHEVLPTRVERWSVTGWYRRRGELAAA